MTDEKAEELQAQYIKFNFPEWELNGNYSKSLMMGYEAYKEVKARKENQHINRLRELGI